MLGHVLALGTILGEVWLLERADASWVMGLVLVIASYMAVFWAYIKFVPARCPNCGDNNAKRLAETWWGGNPGSPIEYECGSCDHVIDTGWTSGDGGG